MFTGNKQIATLERVHAKFPKPKARESDDPAKRRGAATVQVHHSRTLDRVRAYDSGSSGAKGTAVLYGGDQYGSLISDKGLTRGVDALPIRALSRDIAQGHFVMQITTNAAPTLFNATADSAHSLHLESLWVVAWQVSNDLLDPDTAALPLGPLVLVVKGDTIQAMDHVFSNIAGYGHRVYLPWNHNAALAFTTQNAVFDPIQVQRWKHGDGTLKNVEVQLRSAATEAGTPLTFTNAFITFAYTVSAWAK